MNKPNNKGFTLIELLVVVSIIGLLSTMAVVSLNMARAKARDAKRVSDVKQLSRLLEIVNTNKSVDPYEGIFASCPNDGSASTTCMGIVDDTDVTSVVDPSAPITEVCNSLSIGPCNYALASSSPTYYEICFYLEDGSGDLEDGLHTVSNGSVMDTNGQTCSN